MTIGNPALTMRTPEQNATAPGMAFFAHTGPIGTSCGQCKFRGYWRKSAKDKQYHVSGCLKFKQLAGVHGPAIGRDLASCKYFEAAK